MLLKSGKKAEEFDFLFLMSLITGMYHHDHFLSFQSNHFSSHFDLTVDQRAPDKPSENELEVSSGLARSSEPQCELANLQTGEFVTFSS